MEAQANVTPPLPVPASRGQWLSGNASVSRLSHVAARAAHAAVKTANDATKDLKATPRSVVLAISVNSSPLFDGSLSRDSSIAHAREDSITNDRWPCFRPGEFQHLEWCSLTTFRGFLSSRNPTNFECRSFGRRVRVTCCSRQIADSFADERSFPYMRNQEFLCRSSRENPIPSIRRPP